MKKSLFIIVISLLSGTGQLSGQISLELCIEAAVKNYPQFLQYALAQNTASYKIESANKAYLPQFSITAKATYQSDVTGIPLSIPGVSIESMDKGQYGATLQIDQIIWDGGLASARRSSAISERERDFAKTTADIYQIRERVNQLYFGILLMNSNLRSTSILINELNRSVERVKSMVDLGVATTTDLDLLKVELLNAKQREVDLQYNRRAYFSMLQEMTAIKFAENAEFEIPAEAPVEQFSNANRPEFASFNASERFLEEQKKFINAGNMVKVGAFIQGGYGKPGLNMLKNTPESYYIGGLKLSWNLGGLYTAKRDKALLDIQKQNIGVQRELFKYNLNLQIAKEVENIKRLKSALDTDCKMILLREEILKASEAKLEKGTITVTDYLDDISRLDLANLNKNSHEMEYLYSITTYKYLTNN